MYSKLPYMIYGFHGCDKDVKDSILKNGDFFVPSQNDYDWLGSGIYFWEGDAQRAFEFAEDAIEHTKQTKGTIREPAVIGAVIDLGYCLNLLDRHFIDLLKVANDLYVESMKSSGGKIFENKGPLPDRTGRYRDCAVINYLHFMMERRGLRTFDTVRSVFFEGNEIYEKAGFHERTHIQICVRNPNCIKAIFDPREFDKKYPKT